MVKLKMVSSRKKNKKKKKNKIINIYNVMGYRKWCRQEKRKKF